MGSAACSTERDGGESVAKGQLANLASKLMGSRTEATYTTTEVVDQ